MIVFFLILWYRLDNFFLLAAVTFATIKITILLLNNGNITYFLSLYIYIYTPNFYSGRVKTQMIQLGI